MAVRRSLVLLSLFSSALLAQSPIAASRALTVPCLVHDLARQRLVFAAATGELWECDGTFWNRAMVPPLASAVAAYDPTRQRVFYAGANGHLLAYDGHRFADGGPMPAVGQGKLAVDTHRARLMYVVRISATAVQLYEWDGSAWQQQPSLPAMRAALGFAYDASRGVAVLTALNFTAIPGVFETWEWDGTAWSLRLASGNTPGTVGYDEARGRVLGVSSSGTAAWNGSSWVSVPLSTGSPAAQCLASDPQRGFLWAYGGGPGNRTDLWRFDGASWTPAIETPFPELELPAFTFDQARGRAVLLGNQPTRVRDEHHEWDGIQWHTIPTAGGPGQRLLPMQVYDELRAETVVFGGDQVPPIGRTLAWNGTAWRVAASTGPSRRYLSAAAYDAGRGRIVLFGGNGLTGVLQDHWEWDGANWTQVAATTPMGPVLGAMGYDRLRGRCVLLENAHRTWEYDGAVWTLQASGCPVLPTDRQVPLVFDGHRQKLQANLYDGNGSPFRYEWDGVQWTSLGAGFGLLAFDPRRGVMWNYQPEVLLTETTQPATATDLGTPCGGTTTETSLAAFGTPRSGDATFHLDLRAEASIRPALLGFALGPANVPLGNGCTLYLQNPLGSLLWFTDAHGCWHQPFAVPGDLALRGLSFVAQGAVLDPAAPGGLAMTQGLTLVVGD